MAEENTSYASTGLPPIYQTQTWNLEQEKLNRFDKNEDGKLKFGEKRRANKWIRKDSHADRDKFDIDQQTQFYKSMDAFIKAAQSRQALATVQPEPEHTNDASTVLDTPQRTTNNDDLSAETQMTETDKQEMLERASNMSNYVSGLLTKYGSVDGTKGSKAGLDNQFTTVNSTDITSQEPEQPSNQITNTNASPAQELVSNKNTSVGLVSKTSLPNTTINSIKDHKYKTLKYTDIRPTYFRHRHDGIQDIVIGGVTYPVFVTQGMWRNNPWGLKDNETYVYDVSGKKVRRLKENWMGMIVDHDKLQNPSFEDGEDWIDISNTFNGQYKSLVKQKQGGTMNRIKYFEKGGAAAQQSAQATQQQGAQDVQQQIKALVMAAMNEADPKHKEAIKTVNQINAAADQGDPQAQQLVELIKQEVELLQTQARSAKWGAKLGYIRSLKYAQGGKACPACEKGAPIKVEEKACGGKAKKAKKRYFGGWL